MKNLAAGANPIVLRKGMKKATDKAVEAIASMSKPVEGKEQIAKVAAVSSGDEEVGKLVADAMEKVSKDGVITIEESKTMKTELDLVEGMQFDRGYISAYMATDMDKMEANLEDVYKRQVKRWRLHTERGLQKQESRLSAAWQEELTEQHREGR